ncbi:MAG: DUF2064 domain-containing protein [Planctomycetota bacterium]
MHDAVVLIFAGPLGQELSRKGIARQHARLFSLPKLDGVAADVVVSGGKGATFTERLVSAIAEVSHYRRIVIIGRDCPTRTADDVNAALTALRHHDTVLGPDGRGGCWLIGLRREVLEVVDGVRWCRGEDFAELASRALSLKVLAVKGDIDTSADLPQEAPTVLPVLPHIPALFVADQWALPPPALR